MKTLKSVLWEADSQMTEFCMAAISGVMAGWLLTRDCPDPHGFSYVVDRLGGSNRWGCWALANGIVKFVVVYYRQQQLRVVVSISGFFFWSIIAHDTWYISACYPLPWLACVFAAIHFGVMFHRVAVSK